MSKPPLSLDSSNPGEGVALRGEVKAGVSPKLEAEGIPRKEEKAGAIPNSEECPVGGRLSRFSQQWTFSPWALSIISEGLGWEWVNKPPPLRSFFQEETPSLREYVDDLLSKGVVKRTKSLRF